MKRMLSLAAISASVYAVAAEITVTYVDIAPASIWCWAFGLC